MMKASNIYVAQGQRDGIHVMKVGKSNNVKHRQHQLNIKIEDFAECISEAEAYRLERVLRFLIMRHGGIRYGHTKDWYQFDRLIYDLLLQALHAAHKSTARIYAMRKEIEELKHSYEQLLQQKAELQRTYDTLREDNIRLEAEKKVLNNILKGEIGYLKSQLQSEREYLWGRIEEEYTHSGQLIEQARTHRGQLIELERARGQGQIEKLLREIGELRYQLGRLEGARNAKS